MPADWLVDEPSEVPDSAAEVPDDWDEDEDGEWEAPTVANPKYGRGPSRVHPTAHSPAHPPALPPPPFRSHTLSSSFFFAPPSPSPPVPPPPLLTPGAPR